MTTSKLNFVCCDNTFEGAKAQVERKIVEARKDFKVTVLSCNEYGNPSEGYKIVVEMLLDNN